MDLLDSVEVRVLGSLLEKEATTPEYYPLSLNALVNACNQKSNRDPVIEYDADMIHDGVERLREKRMALTIVGSGRVTKYAQRISESLNLGRRELAVLCTLLLRGPQTLGEIRDRSERMFAFADPAETESVLDKLAEWPERSLAKKLPRQAGQKEARYAHLLSGEPDVQAPMEAQIAAQPTRIEQIEQELQRLRSDFDQLKHRFDELEAQFR